MALWKDEEIQLLEATGAVFNTSEIKKLFKLLGFKRSAEAISKKRRALDVKFKDFGVPSMLTLSEKEKQAVETVLKDREILVTDINPVPVLQPSVKAQITIKKKNVMADLMTEIQAIRDSVPRVRSVCTRRQDSDKETLVVILSDHHIGRVVKDTQTNKIIYDIDTGLDRIIHTPDRVVEMLTPDQLDGIDEVVLLLIGDHVDGEGIFPHQEMHLEEHAAEQVLRTTKATWHMIQKFRQLFPMCRIVTTKGNHGRSGSSPESNWDNMIFQQLELLVDLEDDENLTIKNRYGDFNILEVKGWKGLVRHKAPVQADTSAGISKYAGWHGIHGWDFFCFGHFHHWGVMTWNGKPIFRNGSLVGGDDYAESFAAYDDPAQLMFGVKKDELPTFIYPIKYK